jgi:hypothetical protein
MCLTVSGAPVAMKHRAMEPVNKVKILPVYIFNKLQSIFLAKALLGVRGLFNYYYY